MAEMIQGIDVAHHQGDVNFAEVAGDGFRFCIAKATEGADYEDPRFRENMQKIAELRATNPDFYAGAYHFARPDNRTGRSGGETEGRWFSKILNEVSAQYGFSIQENFFEPALDFEKYSDSNGTQNIPWIEGFLHVLKEETGRKGQIYTGPNIWMYEVSNTDQFVDWPLWEVTYSASGSDPNASPPRMPKNAPDKEEWVWTLWQWSGGGDYAYYHRQFGDIAGIPSGICDVNRLNGDENRLRELVNANGCPPPPDPPPSGVTWPRPPQQIDINNLRGSYSEYVARVQGLLLAHKYGPDGLTNSSGLPDGLMGNKTESYLKDFKSKHGLSADTVMDWDTWWALAYDKLRV
jgi:GH25 family lysozyme M1 (1,4-beta-N-acetylmuramidase)